MGREIYNIINDMAEVLNASQMQKLQEVLINRLSENNTVDYLQTVYQAINNCGKVTIDNIRRSLSTFFSWLEEEDYIIKSPMKRIHKVKTAIIVKDTISDEKVEILRDNCNNLRDRAKINLINYIESRTDNNSALFVSLNKPHSRLTESGVELRLREMGRKLGVEKVHPHKFRRTMATRAIEKGA